MGATHYCAQSRSSVMSLKSRITEINYSNNDTRHYGCSGLPRPLVHFEKTALA
jgi:hypothetical protein